MNTKLTVIQFNPPFGFTHLPEINVDVPDNCVEEVRTRVRTREAVTYWQSLGLMPQFADGTVLVWKHVQNVIPPESIPPQDCILTARAIYNQLFGSGGGRSTGKRFASAAMESLTSNSDSMDDDVVDAFRLAITSPKKQRHKEPDKWKGNLGFEYQTGKEFKANNSMACAGPMGCIREWLAGNSSPHLLAIRTPLSGLRTREVGGFTIPNLMLAPNQTAGYYGAFTTTGNRRQTEPLRDGVFVFDTGTPVAVYRAVGITQDGCDLKLVEGMDVLPLIGWE